MPLSGHKVLSYSSLYAPYQIQNTKTIQWRNTILTKESI